MILFLFIISEVFTKDLSPELGLVIGLQLPQDSQKCVKNIQDVIGKIAPFRQFDGKNIENVKNCLNSVSSALESVPNEISSCKSELSKDCRRFTETFKVFQQPQDFNLSITGLVSLRGKVINDDLNMIKSNLLENNLYQVSLTLGGLVRKMLFRETSEKELEDFFEGFVRGVGLTSNVRGCLKNPENSIKQFEEGLKDLESFRIWTVAMGLKKIAFAGMAVMSQVKSCDTSFADEVAKVESALYVLSHPFRYKLLIAKDILFNGVAIANDVQKAKDALKAGYFYDFGYDLGFFISKFE
jgi:hypothetical protein